MNWLLYVIPWEWKLAAGVLIALVVGGFILRLFGVRWGLIAAGALGVLAAAGAIYNRGQQQGFAARKAEEERVQKAALDDFQKVHDDAARKTDPDLDRTNTPWVRPDPKG